MATYKELMELAAIADQNGETEEARQLVEMALKAKGRPAPEPTPEPEAEASVDDGKWNKTRAFAQGILLGWGDEAEAFIRSAYTGEEREDLLKEIRKDISAYKKQNPITAGALEIGGSILPSLVPAGLAARGAMAAGRVGTGLARTALGGAAAGAVEGGIAGAGTADSGDRLGGAATGAALGATIGAAAPFAVAGGADVLRRAADGLGVSGQKRAAQLAERRVGKALEQEQLTPEQALVRVTEARQAGVPMTVADIGENTRGAAYVSQSVPSEARTEVADLLTQRGVEQGERIADATAQRMDATGAYGLDYLDEIYEQAEVKFKPLYAAADKPIPAEPFRKYGNRKVFRDAFKAIQRRADTLGDEVLEDLDEVLDQDVVPTSYLQKIAQGLDRVIENNTDPVTKKISSEGKDILQVRNEFKSIMGKLNPDFAKADKQFSDMSDLRDAFDVGSKFMNMDGQAFARKVDSMTMDQVEAMKVGMITKIRDATSGADATDYVKSIFGNKKRRDALKKAFASDAEFADFEKYMKAERDLVSTQRRVLGGSATQRNIAESQEQGVDPSSLLQMAIGGRGEVMRQAAGGLGGLTTRAQGVGGPVAKEMSDLLFANTPAAQREAMERVAQRRAMDAARTRQMRNQPQLYGGILGAAAGLNQEDLGY